MPDMQPWEFLIQQDGDRAWLPLDTADVEILEGRYRIAAKSPLKNTPVSVRVRYDAIDEIPPKRRTQTRTQQTNQKGLMVIIPYTTLLPGFWEFQCTSETGTVQAMQLKVLSIASDLVEDWNPDWEDAEHATLEFVAPALESNLLEPKETSADLLSIDDILQDAESESGTIADEILREYGLVSESPYEDFRAPQNPMLPDSVVAIALVQDTFIANRGEPLTISGQITSEELTEIDHAELRICLRDPQSSKMLLETREMLQNEALPFQLKYRVTLPIELKTQVILGEITLHDLRVEGHPALATQSFSLMSAVDELVDAMHEAKRGDHKMAEDMLDLPTTRPTAAHPPLNLTFLNFVTTAKESEGTNFTVKESSSLPPQLRQPNPYVRRKLDLPTFGIQPDVANPEYIDGTQLEIPLSGASVPLEVEPEPIQESEPTEVPDVKDLYLAPLEESAPDSDLKVQADDRDFIPETATLNLQPSSDEVVNEFVVDDEPILPLNDLIISRRNHSIASERARNPLLLPETEPVPDPIVLIAEPELIGGKSTTVRLKLPDIVPKIYAKLWVSDRQNRSLIEPSRWIIDFKPDGHGNLEATTEIKVPFECVEIQIEAIAVEVMTNRESHKVVVTRQVVPEELPDLWLDDLDTDSISL